MLVNFRQGIVSYPSTGPIQSFLAKTGVYVTLQTSNGDTVVAFADGNSDYLYTEGVDVEDAWGPIPVSTDTWLFWDIDTLTAERTFGITLLQPQYGTSFPVSPQQGQHFFHTVESKMYLFDQGEWRKVIRVFAAMVNNATFTPLGIGVTGKPFAGTQVGLSGPTTVAGHILFDEDQEPIVLSNGEFLTEGSQIFAVGAPVSSIRIEASVVRARALEPISIYQVVYFSQFGSIQTATYDELQDEAIAITLESFSTNAVGTVLLQGVVTNDGWSWDTVGTPLWVNGNGVFVDVDPHVDDPITYPQGKPPIARVLTPTSIYFDQGLGGKGDQGVPGSDGNVDPATETELGTVRLSVAANNIADPIVAGDNDPRLTDARTPLVHVHAQSDVTGLVTDLAARVLKAGDTMTGFLTLNADPTNALHAATKQYVDAASGSPAGNNTEIQFNNSGAFGADPDFTWNSTTHILQLGTVATPATIRSPDSASAGANLSIVAGSGVAAVSDGGDITVKAGDAGVSSGTGGTVHIRAGAGENDIPGDITLYAGYNYSADPTKWAMRVHSALGEIQFNGDEFELVGRNELGQGTGITIKAENVSSGNGPTTTIAGGTTTAVGVGILGGEASIVAGTVVTAGGGQNHEGGVAHLTGGAGGSVAQGATFVARGGKTVDGSTGDGGDAIMASGVAETSGVDGSLFFKTGATTQFATTATERFRIDGATGAWGLSGATYGSSGQILTSNGPAAAPTWQSLPYDIAFAVVGVPPASTIVLNHAFVRNVTMPDDFAGSQAVAQVAATALTTFSVLRNGSPIGSISFAAAATVGTFTTTGGSAETFTPGQVLTVLSPATPDATLANISITFFATLV